MGLFLPFPLLLAEIVLFVALASRFGFFPVFGAYLLPSLLGVLLLGFQSRHAMMSLVRKLQEGHRPEAQLLSTAAKFVGALLFLPPFVSPRLLGLALLLPGTRHLLILVAQGWLAKKAAQGSARMWTGGFGRPGGFGGIRFETFEMEPERREERDADVIEVKALPPRDSDSR